MNKIEKIQYIKKETLNQKQYLQSLLQQAQLLGLFSHTTLEKIQMNFLELLSTKVRRFTSGESSSVTVETAQNSMESIFYTIGHYLKNIDSTELQLLELEQKSIPELYEIGKKLIEEQTLKAKRLLTAVQQNKLDTQNHAYHDTLNTELKFFFHNYDIEFGAYSTAAIISYPLCNDKIETTGIEYIYDYLTKLYYENNFCQKFDSATINHLLHSYHSDYKTILFNLFERILTNAIGCLLCNKPILNLTISPLERDYLQQQLTNLSQKEIYFLLKEKIMILFSELSITKKAYKNYIYTALMPISAVIKNALTHNQLQTVFITIQIPQNKSVIQFESTVKMENTLFTALTNEIRDCRFVSDKITLIQKNITAIDDFIDLLEADCLFEEEYTEAFKLLNELEMAFLYKNIPEELEKEWQINYINYFNTLPSKAVIKNLAPKIDSTQI